MDDVIVIGAGPAGSTAARRLADQGLRVRILEARTFPRVKPCGGAMTTRALDLLPSGYEPYIKSQPTQWTFSNGNKSVTIDSPAAYCHTVERQFFDQWLASQAVNKGAYLVENAAVVDIKTLARGYEVTTANGDVFGARYLVGADGGHGVSARLLGLPRAKNGAAVEVEISVSDRLFARWKNRVEIDIARYPWGYAWVIPRYPVLNIGVGSFRPQKLSLKTLLHEYVSEKLPAFDSNPRPKILAHPLPYRTQFASLSRDRAVLVGDAAGLMDAFSAEGIYSALSTGHLAADSITKAAFLDGPIDGYQARMSAEFWPNLRSAVKLAHLFYPLAQFWSNIFLMDTALLETYLSVAQGTKTYKDLVHQTSMALLTHAKIRVPRLGMDRT